MSIFPLLTPIFVGLDVQLDGIFLVAARKHWHSFCIEKVAWTALPEGVWTDGRIRKWEIFREIIADLVQENHLQGTIASLCLPMQMVRVKQIQVPTGVSDEAIRAEIFSALERDFPGMKDVLSIDFTVLAHTSDAYQTVSFVAARQDYLMEYTEVAQAAGLNVKVMDVDLYSLQRLLKKLMPMPEKKQKYLALYFMASSAIVFGFDQKDILFYQQWDIILTPSTLSLLKKYIDDLVLARNFSSFTLVVIGTNEHADIIRDEANLWGFSCVFPPFLSQITYQNPQLKIDLQQKNFLLAMSLIQREMPHWT
ncbi:MAG: hypothetical protein ACD_46C00709G0006 [uncultured bacterium]|nr:MAG: hypothetical protein ACD_46C00709G0006 [uncultured bacterium]